jgi:hypothetical protein
MMFDRADKVEPHGFRLNGKLRLLPEKVVIPQAMEILISQMESYFHNGVLRIFARLRAALNWIVRI